MAFTVSCTACGSRFLLGNDLFRRKVSGNIVTVKCRHCEAEISVDARDADTQPSHEAPRKAPSPPRPREKMGLVPPKPMTIEEAESVWDSDETISLQAKPKPEPVTEEAEFVDFEEIPASSSDAPSLSTLMHEAAPAQPPRRNKPAQDFLVGLNPGTGGILGAPSIDVSALTAEPLSEVEAIEIEPEQSTQRTGTVPLATVDGPVGRGTRPLFDMSAVLPANVPANEAVNEAAAKTSSESAAPMQIDIDVAPARKSAAAGGKVRERKHVVAPQDAPADKKAKRGGVLVWLSAAAIAAGVLAVVGMRGHRAQPVAVPEPAPEPSAAVISNAAPAMDTAPAPTETASAETAAPEATAGAQPSPPVSTAAVAATPALVKSVAAAPAPTAELAKAEPAPAAAEKPAEVSPTATAAPAVVEVRKPIAAAEPGTEFDRSAAIDALKSAAGQASSCRKDGDPSGTATLTITFAPSGRVTSATIQGPPFAGTPTGGCIANTMRHAQIPAFDGGRVTVTKTVVIE